MGAPRQPLNPATQSVGFTAKLVTVRSVSPDGATAITVDRQNTQTQVPMLVQRSKGPLPQPGETWLLTQDLGMWAFAAIVATSSGQFAGGSSGTAGGNTITVAAQAPASPSDGDVWLDASSGNEIFWWDGTSWEPAEFGTSALADGAVTAAKIADGTITTAQIAPSAGITSQQVAFSPGTQVYTGTSQPQNPVPGSVWINPVQGNAVSTWNGSTWTALPFGAPAIAEASLTAAQLAESAGIQAGQVNFTAQDIGGITTSVGFSQPSAPTSGDLWYDGNSSFQLKQWSGTAWVPYQFGTQAIAAGSVTAALIAANTITAAQIAAGTITAAQLATGSVTAAKIAAGAVTAAQIQAGTITGIYTGAAYFGQNMIQDPAFSSSLLNSVRTGDPVTNATWTLSGGTAAVTAGSSARRLALMPSGQPDFFVTPGEQFYLAVTGVTSASCQVGIEIAYDNGSITGVSATFSGTQTVTGTVTVPAGAKSGYVRVFAFASSGSPAVTLSNPVCYFGQLRGPDWIINGSGGFFYGGAPAAGDLIAAIVSGSTLVQSDPYGNTVYPGIYSYASASQFAGLAGSGVNLQNGGFPWQVLVDPTTGYLLIQFPHTGTQVYFQDTGTAGLIVPNNPSTLTPETWHAITLDAGAGWSTPSAYAAPFYRLLPDGNVQFAGLVQQASAFTATIALNSAAPLPSAYRPPPGRIKPLCLGSPQGGRCRVELHSDGIIYALGSSSITVSNAEIDSVVSLL